MFYVYVNDLTGNFKVLDNPQDDKKSRKMLVCSSNDLSEVKEIVKKYEEKGYENLSPGEVMRELDFIYLCYKDYDIYLYEDKLYLKSPKCWSKLIKWGTYTKEEALEYAKEMWEYAEAKKQSKKDK